MKHIRLAHSQDAPRISTLRTTEFNRTKDFKVLKPEKLLWNDLDDAGNVLGVWEDEHTLVATLRLVGVHNAQQASAAIEAQLPVQVDFPGLVFSAAATRQPFRRRGFNQLLRYYGIKAALEMGGKSLLSPVYQNAPRIRLMEQLGYTPYILTDSWQDKLAPNSPRMVCILTEKRFSTALEFIRGSIPDLLADYPWEGPSPYCSLASMLR